MKNLLLIVLPLLMIPSGIACAATPNPAETPIDRRALVSRHNVTLTHFEGNRPLQVGNGEFAFGMDATGLQTFVPFNTMSHWGWHSLPLPSGTKESDYQLQPTEMHGRMVPMPMADPKHPEITNWLTGNPHAINLGRIGLNLIKKDGTSATQDDIKDIHQELDLWSGTATSQFTIEGEPVKVITACHPTVDAIAAQVDSPLVKEGRLSVFLDFPGDDGSQFPNFVGNWDDITHHQVTYSASNHRAEFGHRYSNDTADAYHVALTWQGDAKIVTPGSGAPALPLVIQKAEYGARDQWLDVTKYLTDAVKFNRLHIAALNESFGDIDPIKDVPKSLKVTYTLGGQVKIAEIREGQSLSIQSSASPFRYFLAPGADGTEKDGTFAFVATFKRDGLPKSIPSADATLAASRQGWQTYWKTGGAIDLSQSKDPRWKELERRIVLSQYLMKVNEAGDLPPQESGLVNNGWFGRFHFEMIWWHSAQWALWNKWPEFNGNMSVFQKFLAQSKDFAKLQGYQGARWPKAVGNDGREWPFWNHAVMIWQQPHPIFFAEMDYRAHPTKATLEKWRPIVENTADFLASYAFFDKAKGTYVLGPPLNLVSENTDWQVTNDPTFELSYWRTGLRLANQWRERLGEPRRPEWDKVMKGLSPLPVEQGVYVTYTGIPDMWTKWTFEHPGLIGALGMLPGDGVDTETMRRTLDMVNDKWNFNRVWGWDFPMLAMTAAKLNEPERAIDMLMHPSPNFQFDERGLATGGPFPYFPSNGGLLYATAQMAAGWDGAPKRHAPGFPDNGQWTVKYENLSPTL